MRLYLSSYGLGNHPEKLTALFKGNKKVALILNARDGYSKEERQMKCFEHLEGLNKIGLIASEIDLKKFFGKTAELKNELLNYEGLCVSGGNTFLLRRAMRESGFDIIIKELLAEDKIIYAGYSAGGCVLSPTLRGLEIVDDVNAVQQIYGQEPIWEGLNILPYSFTPHYHSNHPESAAIDRTVEFFKQEKMPFKTLTDGQVIIINGAKEEIIP
ncbi:MAG: Type 1 glutamine amidotransferase-like domain-containing protein [Candidatus Komeilibacteria bacterium]|nr:Type 1 glutamine amidotransferase-like domain-containing protein [Candidatus Komeilibacteria bacterium]